jgi:hypothetical protein
MIYYNIEIKIGIKNLEEYVVEYSSNISKSKISFLLCILLYEKQLKRFTEDEEEYEDLLNCIYDLNTLLIREVEYGFYPIEIVSSDYENIKIEYVNDLLITEEEINEIQRQVKEIDKIRNKVLKNK